MLFARRGNRYRMARLLETAFRVTIDFTVTITDEGARPPGDGPAGAVERERRLLLALLEHDPGLLTELLKKYVLIEVATLEQSELEERVLGSRVDEQTLLAPVLEGMSPADAAFFAHAISSGAYAVETERFSECIQVSLKGAALTEQRQNDRPPLRLVSGKRTSTGTGR